MPSVFYLLLTKKKKKVVCTFFNLKLILLPVQVGVTPGNLLVHVWIFFILIVSLDLFCFVQIYLVHNNTAYKVGLHIEQREVEQATLNNQFPLYL